MPGVARKTTGVGGVATPSFHVSPEYVRRNFSGLGMFRGRRWSGFGVRQVLGGGSERNGRVAHEMVIYR